MVHYRIAAGKFTKMTTAQTPKTPFFGRESELALLKELAAKRTPAKRAKKHGRLASWS